jgi:hypothetical protein
MRGAYIFIFSLTLTFSTMSVAQDTLDLQNHQLEIDTVVIYKDPLVLRKTVYVKVKRKEKESWLEVNVSPFYTINRYEACPGWESYLENLENTTSSSPGYSLSANYIFFYNDFLASIGIGYTSFKESFTFTSSTQGFSLKNSFNYLNIPISLGYRVMNKTNYQAIVSGGIVAGKLLSVKGKTISEEENSVVKEIKEVRNYKSTNFEALIKCKILYLLSNTFYIGAEPYCRADLNTITENLEPFVHNRINIGMNASLIFVLR